MAVHLDRARARVAPLMTDTCTVIRDRTGLTDAVLDVETGLLTPNVGNDQSIYVGNCLVTPVSNNSVANRIGAEDSIEGYVLHIPWDSPEVKRGDRITVTAAVDTTLVGHQFKVVSVVKTSFLVWRQINLSELVTDLD